jgi:hypothetical protein
MFSKIHFWFSATIRFMKVLFRSDKNIVLSRTGLPNGKVGCTWTNALWIEMAPGEQILDKTIVLRSPGLESHGNYVVVQGFYRKQTYSLTALFLNESLSVRSFQYSIATPEVSVLAENKSIRIRPVMLLNNILNVKSQPVKINKNLL